MQNFEFKNPTKECEKSKPKFYYYYESHPPILRSYQFENSEAYKIISPFDILLLFGGAYIEETLEKGSSVLPSLKNSVRTVFE